MHERVLTSSKPSKTALLCFFFSAEVRVEVGVLTAVFVSKEDLFTLSGKAGTFPLTLLLEGFRCKRNGRSNPTKGDEDGIRNSN